MSSSSSSGAKGSSYRSSPRNSSGVDGVSIIERVPTVASSRLSSESSECVGDDAREGIGEGKCGMKVSSFGARHGGEMGLVSCGDRDAWRLPRIAGSESHRERRRGEAVQGRSSAGAAVATCCPLGWRAVAHDEALTDGRVSGGGMRMAAWLSTVWGRLAGDLAADCRGARFLLDLPASIRLRLIERR